MKLMINISINSLLPHFSELKQTLVSETIVTIQMVVISGVIAFTIGLLMALALVLFRKDGLRPNALIFRLLDVMINLLRAMPFVILLVAIFPITRFIAGTTLGLKGSIVPLVVATSPFFARQFESALLEVDDGVIEAALSMGSSDFEILYRVYLREALPGIIRATVITLINLLGLTTMVGAVAGGGIGDVAIIYGLRRGYLDITYLVVIIILVMVYIIQTSGNLLIKYLYRGESKNEKNLN